MKDPNPLVSGRGFTRLRDAGVEAEVDAAAELRATEINEAFAHFMRTGRPLVTLKGALTLDGKIAGPDDENTPGQIPWITTSATAREHTCRLLRHAHDAIMTGIGTVLS